MKKFIALSLLLLSAAAFVPSVEAKSNTVNNLTASNALEPQYRDQIYQNRRRNNNRTVRTYVRNVRSGRAVYRETYRVVYRANGSTRTQLVSRVRIR